MKTLRIFLKIFGLCALAACASIRPAEKPLNLGVTKEPADAKKMKRTIQITNPQNKAEINLGLELPEVQKMIDVKSQRFFFFDPRVKNSQVCVELLYTTQRTIKKTEAPLSVFVSLNGQTTKADISEVQPASFVSKWICTLNKFPKVKTVVVRFKNTKNKINVAARWKAPWPHLKADEAQLK